MFKSLLFLGPFAKDMITGILPLLVPRSHFPPHNTHLIRWSSILKAYYTISLIVVIDSPDKFIEVKQAFVGYQSLIGDFKIALTYDALGGPVISSYSHKNEVLRLNLWIPGKEFRKTFEGRIVRSVKRKANHVATWASKMKNSELSGVNSIHVA
ncbi:unnamed protein product [Allacma fusca]|uniref:Uncharacterized protein n=1 Tax=Allacma fusca TaxID=39272 RepID=A0A8J2LH25_9HEXA|nr:unnamed protein product [Allacma fusca]